LGVGSGAGQAVAADAATEAAVEATRVKMTAVRDAFVKATVDAGFTCTIAVPKVVVMDVPSYGNYDVERNVVETPAWELMSAREKGLMYQLAGPGADEAAARAEFETDAHHWIFVHELGHWWQACRGVAHDGRHYAKEYGANRIATAYWRERDSAIVPHMRGTFEMVVAHAPNPVPAGHEVETYFDAHYETLGPSPAYPWFQSRMSLVAFDEKPEPTFAQALVVGTSLGGMTWAAKRAISVCCGEDWRRTREQPAASKSAKRWATVSGVPMRPDWRPRLETE
jgi:hypothetical protein